MHFAPRSLLRSLTQAGLLQFKLLVLQPLLTIGLCPSMVGKNGFSGDISPLLEELFNFHAAVDGPQLGLVKIKT